MLKIITKKNIYLILNFLHITYVLRMGIRAFRHFSHNFLNTFRKAIIHKSHKIGKVQKMINASHSKKG